MSWKESVSYISVFVSLEILRYFLYDLINNTWVVHYQGIDIDTVDNYYLEG